MGIRNAVIYVIVLLITLKADLCLESSQTNTRPVANNKKEKLSSRKNNLKLKNIESDYDGLLEKQAFPDVTYPKSIFESSQPYFYKTNTYDDVLGPFSDDVKSTYKMLSSNMNKPTNKVSTSVNKDKKDVPPTNFLLPIENEQLDSQSNNIQINADTTESNETTQSNITHIKDSVYFDIIYKNGSTIENPIIELGPPSVPVRLKINIEICKEDTMDENSTHTETNTDQCSCDTLNSTEINSDAFVYCKRSDKSTEDIETIHDDKITVLDEINEEDFVNALSILLLDSLNNKPIEMALSNTNDLELDVDKNATLFKMNNSTANITESLSTQQCLEPENSTDICVETQKELQSLKTLIEKDNIAEMLNVTNDNISADVTKKITNSILDKEAASLINIKKS